jgi:hypothetical protein
MLPARCREDLARCLGKLARCLEDLTRCLGNLTRCPEDLTRGLELPARCLENLPRGRANPASDPPHPPPPTPQAAFSRLSPQKSRDTRLCPPPSQRNPLHSHATPKRSSPDSDRGRCLGGRGGVFEPEGAQSGGTGERWSIGAHRATDSTGFGVESVPQDTQTRTQARVDRTPKQERTASSPPPKPQSPTNRRHAKGRIRCHAPREDNA